MSGDEREDRPVLGENEPAATGQKPVFVRDTGPQAFIGPVVPGSPRSRHDAMRYTHLPVFRLASVKALASRVAAESMSPPKKMLNSARAAAIR